MESDARPRHLVGACQDDAQSHRRGRAVLRGQVRPEPTHGSLTHPPEEKYLTLETSLNNILRVVAPPQARGPLPDLQRLHRAVWVLPTRALRDGLHPPLPVAGALTAPSHRPLPHCTTPRLERVSRHSALYCTISHCIIRFNTTIREGQQLEARRDLRGRPAQDHNPPPLAMLHHLGLSMRAWLAADPANVAAVRPHCSHCSVALFRVAFPSLKVQRGSTVITGATIPLPMTLWSWCCNHCSTTCIGLCVDIYTSPERAVLMML